MARSRRSGCLTAGGRARAIGIPEDSDGTTRRRRGCLRPQIKSLSRVELWVGGEEAGPSVCWFS